MASSNPGRTLAAERIKLRDGATKRRRLQLKRNRAVLCSAWLGINMNITNVKSIRFVNSDEDVGGDVLKVGARAVVERQCIDITITRRKPDGETYDTICECNKDQAVVIMNQLKSQLAARNN